MDKEQQRRRQQHLKSNNIIISKLAVIVLSIVLLTGISLVPAIQVGVNGQVQQQQQQQPSQQQKQVGLSQIIKQIAQQIIQEKSSTGKNVSGSVVTKAVQTATGANSNNINQVIRQTAQTLANAAGVPVEYVEAVIIQIALQVSQAQGKAISGQTIFEIANQIAQNPNGILAQAIIQLVIQYMIDNGKTIQTVQIINNVIKTGGSSSKTIVKVFGKPPPKCPPAQHYDSTTGKCVDDSLDPCDKDPTAEGCEDPCDKDPNAEGCTPPPEQEEEVEEDEDIGEEEEIEEEEAEEEDEEESEPEDTTEDSDEEG